MAWHGLVLVLVYFLYLGLLYSITRKRQKSRREYIRPRAAPKRGLLGALINMDLTAIALHGKKINTLRATDLAGETRRAKPNRVRLEDLIDAPHLSKTDNFVREEIHLLDDGTSCRTFSALVTFHQILAADRLDLFDEFIMECILVELDSDRYASKTGYEG